MQSISFKLLTDMHKAEDKLNLKFLFLCTSISWTQHWNLNYDGKLKSSCAKEQYMRLHSLQRVFKWNTLCMISLEYMQYLNNVKTTFLQDGDKTTFPQTYHWSLISPSSDVLSCWVRSCRILRSCSARLGISPALILRSPSLRACHLTSTISPK